MSSTNSLWRWIKQCADYELPAADRRRSYWFVVWCFAWALSFMAASWALKADEVVAGPIPWTIALVPSVLAVVAMFSYLHFLRNVDELMRRIQLEGLAYGFGAGVIFTTGYSLLEQAGAPEVDLSDSVVVMMFAWAIGQVLAMRRYR